MKPILFYLGDFAVHAYGFMISLGFIVGIIITIPLLKKEKLNPEIILDISLIALISGVLGARILFIFEYPSYFDFKIFNITDGLCVWGGILAIIVFIACYKNLNNFIYLSLAFVFILIIKKQIKLSFSMPEFCLGLLIFCCFIKNYKKSCNYFYKKNNYQKILLVLLLFISIIIGMRAVYCYQNSSKYNWNIFQMWNGGLSFHGGLILAIISLALFCVYKKISIRQMFDILAIGVAIGLSITRIGCYLNGCCYGRNCPQNFIFGVQFPPDSLVSKEVNLRGINIYLLWENYSDKKVPFKKKELLAKLPKYLPQEIQYHLFKPVYPTQLISSFNALMLFIFLRFFYNYRKYKGEVALMFCILYSISRFFLDMLRSDSLFVNNTGLTHAQCISIILFFISSTIFIYMKIFKKGD